jgi:hypothetical protein
MSRTQPLRLRAASLRASSSIRGGKVALAEVMRENRAAVGSLPQILGRQRVDLVAVTAPVDEGLEPEAAEDLGELGGMAERVGCVGDRRDTAEGGAGAPPLEEVAYVRLAVRQERVRLHVPRSDRDATGAAGFGELRAALGSHLRIVFENDGLTVEQKAKAGIRRAEVEDGVDRVDEAGAERLEGAVPLAIPMRVGDEKALHVPPQRPAASISRRLRGWSESGRR